ncbi:MAG: MarR family transcriptional regulator [Gemmatimonadaceae bacterium]
MTTAIRAQVESVPEETVSGQGTDPDADRAMLRTWLRMLACTNIIEGRVRGALRDNFNTTLPRFDLLAQLDASSVDAPDGLTMSELSRRLMVTNGNVTGLVNRLVNEGFVSRVVFPPDRRAQLVSLTPAGKRALDGMTPAHATWIREMFEGVSPHEQRELYRLLGRLKQSALTPTGRAP